MRLILITIPLLFLPFLGWSQTDIPTTKPLKIEAANTLDKKGTPNKGLALKVPSVIKDQAQIKLNLDGRNPVKMLPERELVQAGTGMKIDPKVGPREREGTKKYFGDIYIGEVTTTSGLIGLVLRDYSQVDGDKVKIIVNGQVAAKRMTLTGRFEGVNVQLNDGFNKIEFEIISAGSVPPATAQFDAYNDEEQLIFSKRWFLSKKAIGTFIVIKN